MFFHYTTELHRGTVPFMDASGISLPSPSFENGLVPHMVVGVIVRAKAWGSSIRNPWTECTVEESVCKSPQLILGLGIDELGPHVKRHKHFAKYAKW